MSAGETIPISTDEPLRKLTELRAELEVFAVRQIIMSRRPGCALPAEFAPVIARMQSAARHADYATFHQEDFSLHRRIMELAGVPHLVEIWRILWTALAHFHEKSLTEHWPDLRALIYEHEYLVAAICSMDATSAEDGIRAHLGAIWFRIAALRGDFLREQDPLQRATAFLAFHLHREIRLASLAREIAFTSPGHLSKLFRDRYGCGFQAYLQNLRLDKAASLLAQSCLPVAAIARRSGYHDPSRFCGHFRKKFGRTPLQWRRKNRPRVN
jgi:AraC-like DNA-binding protein